MKIVVISDSHGKRDRVEEVLDMHKNADVFLFLGDGLRDIYGNEHSHRGGLFAAVEGNCDGFDFFGGEKYPRERMIVLEEYNILMMHGHTRGVKHGIEAAAEYAASVGADILLYGHTHQPVERYIPEGRQIGDTVLEKPLRIFNPGSLGEPRWGDPPMYGLIEIKGKNVLMSHGSL